jgi:3-deoxy-manno-octulosonate cytidylyltransferase (CMP-KDO synthetase)
MPMLDPAAIRLALEALADPEIDIATLAAEISDPADLADTSVNKVVAGFPDPTRPARALYFSKAVVPWGEGPHYEHIGLYAYRRAALERFVKLPRGILEQRERLEQLRALEAGLHFSVSLIDKARLGVQVDTPADLARARELMKAAP